MTEELIRRFRRLPDWWPVVAAVLGVLAMAVRADSQIGEDKGRIDYLYATGSPALTSRLATIEAKLDGQKQQLDRIESEMPRRRK